MDADPHNYTWPSALAEHLIGGATMYDEFASGFEFHFQPMDQDYSVDNFANPMYASDTNPQIASDNTSPLEPLPFPCAPSHDSSRGEDGCGFEFPPPPQWSGPTSAGRGYNYDLSAENSPLSSSVQFSSNSSKGQWQGPVASFRMPPNFNWSSSYSPASLLALSQTKDSPGAPQPEILPVGSTEGGAPRRRKQQDSEIRTYPVLAPNNGSGLHPPPAAEANIYTGRGQLRQGATAHPPRGDGSCRRGRVKKKPEELMRNRRKIEKPEVCPYCEKRHSWPKELKKHYVVHHPSQALEDGRITDDDRMRLPCEVPGCSVTFSRKDYVRKHVKNKHGTLIPR